MRILYIFNYQREIPPFMQMQIGIAKDYFDRIVYITRALTKDNSKTVNKYENVRIVQVSPFTRKCCFILSGLRSFFNSYVIKSFIETKNIQLFKAQSTTLFMSDCLYHSSKSIIANDIDQGHNVYLLATWFSSEALTIARLNKRLHPIKAVSFAHSFEIDPDKNNFVAHSFNEIKHDNIDKVFYISNRMKDIYYQTAKKLHIKEKYDNKADCVYLGSVKKFSGYNKKPQTPVFKLVSCSGVTPVKRLSLIADTLKMWSKGNLEWTHLGGGPLFDELSKDAYDIMCANPRVRIKLEGWKNNDEVQEYYTTHDFDLFLNVSEAEGLPVSIMEAMSYGIPCVATNVGGTAEIVTPETGFLLSKNCNPNEIKNVLEKYASLSDSEKDNYRNHAKKMWEQQFDSEKTMRGFYEHMIQES